MFVGSTPPWFQTCVLPWWIWMCTWCHSSPQHDVDVDNAIRFACDVDMVQECQQMFVWAQPFSHCDESSVLPQSEQSRHQWVTLLPALSLNNTVHNSHIVLPNVGGSRTVELGNKWPFHGPQTFQH